MSIKIDNTNYQLTEIERKVYHLFKDERCTPEKIAQDLNISVETVRELLHTAEEMERMQRQINECINQLSAMEQKIFRLYHYVGSIVREMTHTELARLFQRRGMKVTETYRRIESQRNGSISVASSVLRPRSVRLSNMEIDILLTNEEVAIAVSVKTTLKVQSVREHLDDLDEFTTFFPRYKGVKLYGAVAGINIEEAADKFAYRQGLFVLTSSGEGMIKILNDENFRPKDFERSD